MASPFEIFRRNQWLVVALFGLSIFAFVLLDPLTQGGGGGRLFPIIMGVLLGGLALWLLSGKSGREAVIWAGAGAVLGGLFVGLGADLFGNRTAIATTAGNLAPEDVEELRNRREVAVGFFGRLQNELARENPDDFAVRGRVAPVRDYAGFVQTPQGNFPEILGPEASRTEDLVFGYLLNREADELGLEVSDAEINRVINEHYGVAPSAATVGKIRTDFGVGETTLFDAVRDELRARRALQLLLPRPATLPADAWTLYRRLNQTADLSLVALPVEAFVDEVPEPTDAEVAELFEEYRARPADPVTGLGFKRDSQIKLGYLRADRAAIAEATPDPTDAEVEAYYAANREEFRNRAYDDYLTSRRMSEGAAGEDGGEDAPADPPALPALPEPGAAPPADVPPAAEQPAMEDADADADALTLPPPAAESEPTEPPAAAEPADDPEPAEEPADKPAVVAPKPDEPNTGGPAADDPKAEEPGAEEPNEDEPNEDEPKLPFAAAGFRGVAFAAVQDDLPQDPPARTPVTAPKPVAKASSAPADGEPEPAETLELLAEPAMADAADDAADLPAPPPPAEPMTEDDAEPPADIDAEPQGEAAPPAPAAADAPPPPEFFPLDEARRASIRERLKRERVDAAVADKIGAAAEEMYTLGSDVWAEVPDPADPAVDLTEAQIEQARQDARETIAGKMVEYAEANGLEYVSTEFVGVRDIQEDTYPVMLAEAGFDADDPFAQRQLLVAPLFGNFAGPLYQVVRTGARPDTGDGFAVWKTDQRYAAEQELTEPGVRDAVVAAWKREKAAELAKARAEEIAAIASRADKTLGDAIAGQTATGEAPAEAAADGEEVPQILEVRPTGPFTRLRLNRQTGAFGQPLPPTPGPAAVPGVGSASDEFLDAAFGSLTVGEAAAAANADGDVVYVLELNDRSPDGENLKDLYEDFLRDAATNPGLYARVNDRANYDSQRAFIDGLFEKYGVSGLDRGPVPEPRR